MQYYNATVWRNNNTNNRRFDWPRSQLSYCKIQKLVEILEGWRKTQLLDVKSRSSWYCPSFLYSFHISSVSWFKIFETEPHFTSCKWSCQMFLFPLTQILYLIAEHDTFFKIWKLFGKDPVQRAYTLRASKTPSKYQSWTWKLVL